MKADVFTKMVLVSIAVLLYLNLLSGLFAEKSAIAQPEGHMVGRDTRFRRGPLLSDLLDITAAIISLIPPQGRWSTGTRTNTR